MGIPAVRLNHAVLFVSDVDRAVEFWTTAFDMEVIAREPRMHAAFLRLRRSGNHHDLGLFGLGAGVQRPAGPGIGLYHLAWQVDTIDDLARARESLQAVGGYVGESSHGATKSLYGKDPDGNEFEVMWMLPPDTWGEFENSAPVERLDLDADVARWSGVGTAGSVPKPVLDAL
jgi:catechol-2,3-dioxygenase